MTFDTLTTSISVSIAAITFVFSALEKQKRSKNSAVRDWQRVIIYSLIESLKEASFKELRSGYIEHIKDFKSKIPNEEIKEDALKRVLLDLQRDSLIIRNHHSKYQVQIKIPMEAWAYSQMKDILDTNRLQPMILNVVETNDGKYTVDDIFKHLKETGVKVSIEQINKIVYSLRGGSLQKKEDGHLKFVPPFGETVDLKLTQ